MRDAASAATRIPAPPGRGHHQLVGIRVDREAEAHRGGHELLDGGRRLWPALLPALGSSDRQVVLDGLLVGLVIGARAAVEPDPPRSEHPHDVALGDPALLDLLVRPAGRAEKILNDEVLQPRTKGASAWAQGLLGHRAASVRLVAIDQRRPSRAWTASHRS